LSGCVGWIGRSNADFAVKHFHEELRPRHNYILGDDTV
jgi:hypothetical protein